MYLWILKVSAPGKFCGQRTRQIQVLEKVEKFRKCFKNFESLTNDDIKSFGGNSSLILIDWMIGSKDINIDGI